MKSTLTFLLGLVLAAVSALNAQTLFRGTVEDSTTHEKLVGAHVSIVGTSFGCATNHDGEFKISGFTPEVQRVRVSYLGYTTRIISIDFSRTPETRMTVKLVPEAIEGSEVVVTAQMRGQQAAVNQQVRSTTIVNVVSEERIKELPDANAAEAIGRLPGVALQRSGGEANKVVVRGMSDRFGSITVDGMRIAATDVNSRGVDLSTISQGTLAGIELFKALTPDKDADAIAGSVNLVTRKAPSQRELRLDGKNIYNRLDKTNAQYDLTLKYGERFFDDILGVQVNGNLERRNRSADRTNVDYGRKSYDLLKWEITNWTLEYTNEWRTRGGGGVLLDVNTPDGGSIRVNNIYNSTKRDYTTYTRNYALPGINDIVYTGRIREQELSTFNSSIRGENHAPLDVDVTWGFSYAQSKSTYPYDLELDFMETSGMKDIPEELKQGPVYLYIPYAKNDTAMSRLQLGYYRGEEAREIERTLFLDLAKKYSVGNDITGEIKLGGKYRDKSRYKESSELFSPYYVTPLQGYYRLPGDSVLHAKDFTGTRFEGIRGGSTYIGMTYFVQKPPKYHNVFDDYYLFPMLEPGAMRQWYDLNKYGVEGSVIEYARNYEADAYYYDVTERVNSFYLMNTLNIGQSVKFIAGVRMEHEVNDYTSRFSPNGLGGFPTPKGTLRDTSSTYSQVVWLPNFHLTISPFENMNLRFAAYRAIARPDFNHRLENFVARSNGTFYQNNVLFVGNPNLQTAKAWNYEVNASVFGEYGLVSASVFYKRIDQMFHVINGVRLDGKKYLDSLGVTWPFPFQSGQEYRLTYPYNSNEPTHVYGLEGEFQSNFSFLPGVLKGIVLNANFSLVRSKTHILLADTIITWRKVGRITVMDITNYLKDAEKTLEGQPEFFMNVALGYDIGGFSGRVSLFYQSQYNQSFSGDGRADGVVNSYTRLDVSLKQQVFENLAIMLNVNNILNTEDATSVVDTPDHWGTMPNTAERYGMSADLGFRLTF